MDKNNTQPENPLVTVLTLCYNTGKFVLEALDCIKKQTYKNIQHIIIDDCSSDNSVQLIESWIKTNNHSCIFLKNISNIGIPAVFNKALKISTGKYITWISDDLWGYDRIEKTITIFESLPENVGVMFGKMDIVNSEGLLIGQNTPEAILKKLNHLSYNEVPTLNYNYTIIPGKEIKKELFCKCFIPAPSVTVRRAIYKVIGEYDESITIEDLDCWFRTAEKFDFVFVSINMASYRLHNTNYTSGLNENYIKSLIKILKKNSSPKNDAYINKIIKKHIREEAYRIIINLTEKKYLRKAWKYLLHYYFPNFQLTKTSIKETSLLIKKILAVTFHL